MTKTQTIKWAPLSEKHKSYIRGALKSKMSVAEGAIRSGKTIDNCIIAAAFLETCPDKIHLASGSSIGNAKLNIGDCNGFGLEHLFRGRCRWGKYKDNEALRIHTQTGEKIVIFAGGGKADSYKRILGNSYGLWIATEINEHYDSDDSRTSFFKVAFGRQAAAIQPKVLWDLNPCHPHHKIYTDYIDKYLTSYVGGYQYKHFTINDNLSVSDQRKREIISQYDPNTVWYKRDILGMRYVADGLIYQHFANNEDRYDINKDDLQNIKYINIGVDFGGNKSQHAFVASGFDAKRKTLYVLKSVSVPATGTSVAFIIDQFSSFAKQIEKEYGFLDYVYADSAEQAIINEMWNKTGYIILPSIKNKILDRIRCEDILFNSNRIYFVKGENEDLKDGLRNAVWDNKKLSDERLDDGTSNIDILDAFEYSFEPYMIDLLEG